MPEYTQTSIKLNDRLNDALTKRSEAAGVSKASIMRLALEQYLGLDMEEQR